jgi:chromosome segregation ATPase
MKIQTQIIKWLFNVDVESQQMEIIKLTNSLTQSLKDLTDAKSTICNINNQKEELQNQHHNYIVEKQTLLNDKRELYMQLHEAQESLAEKHNQLTEKLLQIETYAKEIDTLKGQITEQNNVILNQNERINEQNKVISEHIRRIDEQKEVISSINGQKEKLQIQHDYDIVERENLLRDKGELHMRLNEAQKSLAEKHNQLTERLRQIDTYAQEVDALNGQLAEQKEAIANYDESIKGQEDIITHCKENNKWLSKQCQNLSLQLDEVTEEFEATERLLSQEVKSYKLQLENKVKDVDQLIGQIEEKKLVIAYNDTKISELTECVSKLECTIKEQKSQMIGYAKNVSALQKQLNESNRRFDEAQNKIKKYEESIKLVVDVVGEEYRSSLNAKDGLIQAVSNDLSKKTRLINELREDVSKLKREKIALQDEISQYKKNMKDLGNQLKTRSPEAKLIDSLYKDIEQERISNSSLKERLKERNEKIIALQKEVDEKIRSYERIKAEAIELGKEVKLLQMKIKM